MSKSFLNKLKKYLKIRLAEKWIYLAREITIVVIGVLVAFVLNSWWMNVKDIKTEKVIFNNLYNELIYNNQELEKTLKIHQFVLSHTETLLDHLNEVPFGENVEVADTVLIGIIIAATYNPSTGNINSILSSGKLDFIKNNDLVIAITSWNNKLDDAVEDEQTSFDFIEDHFIPYLGEQVDLAEGFNNAGDLAKYSYTGDLNLLEAKFLQHSVPIKCTIKLKNLLAQRKMRLKIAVNALKRLEDHQDYMLSLIVKGKN